MKATILPTTTTKNRMETKFKSAFRIAGQLLTWASISRPPLRRFFPFVPLLLACLALLPIAQAVVPPPDGGYANGNTAEGTQALFSLTTGAQNTANGFQALYSNRSGAGHTAIGFQALYSNTSAGGDNNNTAVGFQALYSNTIGQ